MGQTTVFPEEPQGARNDDAYVAGSVAAALSQGRAFGELDLLLRSSGQNVWRKGVPAKGNCGI